MSVKVTCVKENSYGEKAGILKDDEIKFINGREITDVLDYRFAIQSKKLSLTLNRGLEELQVNIRKSSEFSDIGLDFETYLMDKQHSCKNKCIFCFVDQMPEGMRDTLYFKDDDSRLSFLFGNYITLTNLTEKEADRICEMHISPVNISVHTMNPQLRVKMMKNKNAGDSLRFIKKFHDAGILMNTQLVLCPGINDGEELRYSLTELAKYSPYIKSIAAVPVGLTKYRDGLERLEPYTKETANEVISIIDEFNAHYSFFNNGKVLAFASDEFYLLAEKDFPDEDYYGEYSQLDNGVGMCTLLKSEFLSALEEAEEREINREITLATGESAYSLLCELTKKAEKKFKGLKVNVVKITNVFFGTTVTVAGLLTGQDLKEQLKEKKLGEELLIPRVSLRNEGDKFLDDLTLGELAEFLNIKVLPVKNDGYELLNSILGGA
ncbi:MAG: DUF512 domain-containing protein [Ruminococcaceae bacterium]|nr:DUF512 domain-containing protein [Oscillospiraceae bacterium]